MNKYDITYVDSSSRDTDDLGLIYSGVNDIVSLRISNTGTGTPATLKLSAASVKWTYSGASTSQGQEVVDNLWLEARVGAGAWTPIGGDTSGGHYLSLTPPTPGNYVDVSVRLNVPDDFAAGGIFSFNPFAEYAR